MIGSISTRIGNSPSVVAANTSLVEQLDELVPNLLDRFDIPGATIALIQRGTVSWTNAYGYADLESNRRMTTDTICRPESITKSITAWGIMRLVEEGAIDLDASVTKYVTSWEFPESDFGWEDVTIRGLLSHSAGLPGGIYENFDLDESPPSLIDALEGQAGAPAARPIDEPKTQFRYSNPGYVLLELVIEDVTGRDYAEFIESTVLQPLGMEQATFEIDSVEDERLATNYTRTGKPVHTYHEAARAHGMVVATIKDIAKFVAASVSGPHGSPVEDDTVQTMYAPEIATTGFHGLGSTAYGLGHLIETLPDGERAVMHGGQGTGSWAWFQAVPETGDGIAILTNSERSLRLIATVVSQWSRESNLGSTSLSRTFSRVETAVKGTVAASGIAALGVAGYLGKGLHRRTREFSPTSPKHRWRRVASATVVIGLFGIWWFYGYPFMDQLLPGLADWVGVAFTFLLIVIGMYTLTIPVDLDTPR